MQIENIKRRGKVDEAEIVSKDQRWHCRNRITLVFGSNDPEELETYIYTESGIEFKTVAFHQAKSKAIEEILDNSIDEYYRGHVTQIHTELLPDGKTVVIEDNGIGFPVDKIKQVYTEFRTGSKFRDEEVDDEGFLFRTLGQNGLGASATCLTSDSFKATVRHYKSKKELTYTFTDGALKAIKGKEKSFSGHSGVKVEFQLSNEVYKDNRIDPELLRKRIIDLAYNNPGLTFFFNKEKYHFKKGLYELAARINPDLASEFGSETIIFETTNSKGQKVKGKIDLSLSVVVDKSSDDRERFISFVNSTPTFDGGFHQDRVKRIFINTIKEKLERSVKKEKLSVVDNDILAGLTFVLGVTMPNPRFESQTKRKLVRDLHLEKAIESFMSQNIEKFIRKNKEYLDACFERAKSRQRFQDFKEAQVQGKKQSKKRVEKLLDANERKDRSNCSLFICEGDSAIGGLRSARDKLNQGGIALKGKPMNVSQSTLKDVLANQEFADIMASIGLTIGVPVDESSKLRYSKIVFLADSDVDGGHINTLLTNFFYTFWPEMFAQGMICIAKAPLFEVILDKDQTIYAESNQELEKIKNSGKKIREIHRNKGLGEMSPEAFKYVLNRGDYTKITVENAKEAKEMLDICFGKDSAPRKNLLIDTEHDLPLPASVKAPPATSAKKQMELPLALEKNSTTKKKVSKK